RPFAASSTVIPSASRFTRQRRRIGASSSMTRTVVTVPGGRYTRRPGCSRPGQRQREAEARPLPLGGVDPDASTHGGDAPLRDEEAEARAASAALGDRLRPVELAEDSLLLQARDPDPLVD